MTQTLSINLPDQLLDRLHRLARASDRPVEELVVSTLDESVPRPPPNLPPEICEELSLLETLRDPDLVKVAQSTLKAEEVPSVYQPGDVTDRLALRKAYALVLLKWRGCTLRGSGPGFTLQSRDVGAWQNRRTRCALLWQGLFLVVQNANCGSVEIVELPAADGPNKGGHTGGGQKRGDRQQDVDHTHDRPPNVRAVKAKVRTVKELIGIRIAANKGPISPVIASVAAIAL
jgi:hypothetical protein